MSKRFLKILMYNQLRYKVETCEMSAKELSLLSNCCSYFCLFDLTVYREIRAHNK